MPQNDNNNKPVRQLRAMTPTRKRVLHVEDEEEYEDEHQDSQRFSAPYSSSSSSSLSAAQQLRAEPGNLAAADFDLRNCLTCYQQFHIHAHAPVKGFVAVAKLEKFFFNSAAAITEVRLS